MSKLINPTAQHYIATEADRFPDAPTKDGSAADRESATITRNEDIGSATDSAATDSSGRKTGISLWKGILNKIPAVATIESLLTAVRDRLPSTLSGGKLQVDVTFPASQSVTFPSAQAVSVSNFPPTQPVSLASQPLPIGASTEATLTSLLNATTLNTTQVEELAYPVTAASRKTNFVKLKGRVHSLFIPATLQGNSIIVWQRRVDGSGAGSRITTSDAVSRTILLDQSTDRAVDADSISWLAGAIGSEIAFEVQGADQSSTQNIYVKVLV